MKLGNSWNVTLAVLRENGSSFDSWRRTDLGGKGQRSTNQLWFTSKVFLWLSLAYIYSCHIIAVAWSQMVPLRMRHGLGAPL